MVDKANFFWQLSEKASRVSTTVFQMQCHAFVVSVLRAMFGPYHALSDSFLPPFNPVWTLSAMWLLPGIRMIYSLEAISLSYVWSSSWDWRNAICHSVNWYCCCFSHNILVADVMRVRDAAIHWYSYQYCSSSYLLIIATKFNSEEVKIWISFDIHNYLTSHSYLNSSQQQLSTGSIPNAEVCFQSFLC